MRANSWAVAGALTILGATAAFATTPAFEDNKLNIKGCDGAQVSVRWIGDNFTLSTSGKVTGRDAASFELVDWDGKCQTISWDAKQSKFAVGGGGSDKSSALVRFTATDGARWVAMRDGDGFFVTRIASTDEKLSPTRISEIAAWLERSSKPHTSGLKLAEHLKAVAID